jgi:5-methylcytosine-specific restriction endonuclease McrBC regulatory subunit McrC
MGMKKKRTRNIKKRKHDKIVKDFDKTKEKHLERLADKMLEKEEQNQRLKEKQINTDFLELF